MVSNKSTQPTAFETAADLYGKSANVYEGLTTGAGSLSNINKYIDPYHKKVLNATLGRMGRNFETQLDQVGDAAQAASAFGGSRHGLVEAEAREGYNRNVGDVTAQIKSQAFNDAAERAYRDQVTGAQGLTGLGGNYYQIGADVADRQLMQGSMQQQLLQTILTQGAQGVDQQLQHPYDLIDLLRGTLAGDARRNAVTTESSGTSSTTQQTQPGLYDWVSMWLQA